MEQQAASCHVRSVLICVVWLIGHSFTYCQHGLRTKLCPLRHTISKVLHVLFPRQIEVKRYSVSVFVFVFCILYFVTFSSQFPCEIRATLPGESTAATVSRLPRTLGE
jgi:hypothetical protein